MFWPIFGNQGSLGSRRRGCNWDGERGCLEHRRTVCDGVAVVFELFPDGLLWVLNRCLVLIEVKSIVCEVVFYTIHGFLEVFWVDHNIHVVHVRKDFCFCVQLSHGVAGGVNGLVESVHKAWCR